MKINIGIIFHSKIIFRDEDRQDITYSALEHIYIYDFEMVYKFKEIYLFPKASYFY